MKVNTTVILFILSLITIVSLLFFSKGTIDYVFLMLLLRIPIYFIPCFYISGNFKIGIAYAIVQCLFSYYIGNKYKGTLENIARLMLLFSIAISMEVFAVLLLNNISIFASNLKWYMVIPMGKSNYISCMLLPCYALVDTYYRKYSKRILIVLYSIFILVAILGTGSKLALVLFLGYQVFKFFQMLSLIHI